MFPFLKVIVFIICLLPIFLALEIKENKIDRGKSNFDMQDITIKSGVFWSIVDNSISTFLGSLTVEPHASFFVSLTSPILALQVAFVSIFGVFHNQGNIIFDSRASFTSATYRIATLTFRNTGKMFFSASGTFPNTMDISASNWTNDGLLSFHQDQRTSGVVSLGLPLGTIVNNGQIKLSNQVYQQRTQINGTGCFIATNNSTIYISNSLLPVYRTQNFYLADDTSSIIVDSFSATQTFNVYGFGNGNKIGLTLPLVGNYWYSSYTYDATTGILVMRNVFLEQKFNIGLGYNPSLFKVVTDWGAGIPSTILGSLSYSGCVPLKQLPSICKIELISSLDIPGTKPTQFTSTFISTDDSGRNAEYVGMFDVATNKNFEWVSAMAIITTLPINTVEYPVTPVLEAQWLPTVSSFRSSSSTNKVTPIQSTETGVLTTISLVQITETLLPSGTFSTVKPLVSETTSLGLLVPTKTETQILIESSLIPVLPPKLTYFTNSSLKNEIYSSEVIVDREPISSELLMSDEVSNEVDKLCTDEFCVVSSDFSIEADYSSYYGIGFETFETFDTIEAFGSAERFETAESFHIAETFDTVESLSIVETSQKFEISKTSIETSEWSTFSFPSELFSGLPPPLIQSDTPVSFNSEPTKDTRSEMTIMWEVTDIQGSIITESGIILISGEYETTVTTFPQDSYQLEGHTKYTKTWEVTNNNGSVVTESGLIEESGSYHTTVTTFPPNDRNWAWAANTIQFTKTWLVTNADGSIITESGIVGESDSYQTTVTTFPQELSLVSIYQTLKTHLPETINTDDTDPIPLATSLSVYRSVVVENESTSLLDGINTGVFNPTTGLGSDLSDDSMFIISQSLASIDPIESDYISESAVLDSRSLVTTQSMKSPTSLTAILLRVESSVDQFEYVSTLDSKTSGGPIRIVPSEFPELDAPLIIELPDGELLNKTSVTSSIAVNETQNGIEPEFRQNEDVIITSTDSDIAHSIRISEETSGVSNYGDVDDDFTVNFVLLTLNYDNTGSKATLVDYSWKLIVKSDEVQIGQTTGDYNYSIAAANTHHQGGASTQQSASTQQGTYTQQGVQQGSYLRQDVSTQQGTQQGTGYTVADSHFEDFFSSKTTSTTTDDFTRSFDSKDNTTDISTSFFAHLLIVGNSTVFETDYTDFSFIPKSNTSKLDIRGIDFVSNRTYNSHIEGSNVSSLVVKSGSVVPLTRTVIVFVLLAISVVFML